MKYLLVLFYTFALVSCSEDGEQPPISFPRLKIINESGVNLLNPENESSYDSSYITGYFLWNELPTVEISVYTSNKYNYKDLLNYYLYVDLDHRIYKPIVGTNILVVRLSESEIDTLNWIVSEKNGAFYSEDLIHESGKIIRQNTSDNFLTWIK